MKYFMIAFQSLKKKKGDAIALFFLIAFATVMMYVGVSVFSNLGHVLDITNERNNGADVLYGSPCPETRVIQDTILEYEGVKTLEVEPAQYVANTKYWRDDEEEDEMAFLIESLEQERRISVPEIVNRGEQKKANSIVLPYYLHVGMGYETGDTVNLKIGKKVYKCEIYGFIEDVLFATPANVSVYRVWLAEKTFKQIKSETVDATAEVTLYRIKLEPGYEADVVETDLYKKIAKRIDGFAQYVGLSANYETMRYGDSITASMLTAILIAFALIILLITTVIICFSIQNSLERNMTNTGILEASGYTAGQLVASTLIEMGTVTVLGLLVALVVSPAFTEMIGGIVASSIGVRWSMGFDVASAGLTVVTVLVFVLVATYAVARRYKKISILDALRGGVKTHNFRKNHVPLEKTFLPTHVALGIKGILNQKRKSMAIGIITVVMAIACNCGFFLYQNLVQSMDQLLNLVGIERASAQITIPQGEDIHEVGEAIAALGEVEQINYYMMNTIEIENNGVVTDVQAEYWETTDKLVTNTLAEGRHVKYDNEIVLSRPICEDLGAEVGDTVKVTNGEVSEEYLIVGMTQHISFLGRKAVMTFEGIQRVNEAVEPNILMVYKNENATFADLEKAIHALYPNYEIVDVENVILSTCSSISAALSVLCVVFCVCTMVIVISIIFLMIRMKLTQEKVSMGVDKALGFTTLQLITRVTMNYLPVVFVGTIIGGVLAYVLFNPLASFCLSFCGIRSCNMDRGIGYIVLTVVIITITAFFASFIVSAKIRKIEPCKMIRE